MVKLYGLKLCCLIELGILKEGELAKELLMFLDRCYELDEDELIASEPIELVNAIVNKLEEDYIENEIATIIDKLKERDGN